MFGLCTKADQEPPPCQMVKWKYGYPTWIMGTSFATSVSVKSTVSRALYLHWLTVAV